MLEVKGLSKTFTMHIRSGKRIDSISDVSFRLSEGRMIGVTGKSGIGKSTLLKCIYRTYVPTAGDILYERKDGRVTNIAAASEHEIISLRKEEIGYVSQFFHVIPRITALEIITQKLIGLGHERPDAVLTAEEYLGMLRLPRNLWVMYPSTFSGGEKQRLNIILAVVSKPRLLLLDEPTASLDRHTKQTVLSLLGGLKRSGTAMIGVFHDMESMNAVADETLELGRIPRERITA